MNEDAKTIKKIERILSSDNLNESLEVLGIALSVHDDEDRDLLLLEVIRWLIKNNEWQKALGASQLMSESYEKSEGLQIVAEKLASIGHIEKALLLFGDAEIAATDGNLAEWQQAELLNRIANSLTRINATVKSEMVRRRAIFIAQQGQNSISPQDCHDAISVLGEIAEDVASEHRIQDARMIAQTITNVAKREYILLRIANISSGIRRVA